MAGIWNRIIPGEDRLSSHLIAAAVYFAVDGTFTNQQLLNSLNSKLTTPLDAAAQSDLANIVTQGSSGAAVAKVDYNVRLERLCIAVEDGLLTNEATFRSKLGIA